MLLKTVKKQAALSQRSLPQYLCLIFRNGLYINKEIRTKKKERKIYFLSSLAFSMAPSNHTIRYIPNQTTTMPSPNLSNSPPVPKQKRSAMKFIERPARAMPFRNLICGIIDPLSMRVSARLTIAKITPHQNNEIMLVRSILNKNRGLNHFINIRYSSTIIRPLCFRRR